MRNLLSKLVILIPMLIGLPVLGVWLNGRSIGPYLQFPPETLMVEPPAFSWVIFVGLLALTVATLAPFIRRLVTSRPEASEARGESGFGHRFPWWGWGGLCLGLTAWTLAWTRMDWFAPWQMHTFTPLWMAYIIVINAMTWRRTGGCMMVDRPLEFLALFPLSAVFWWFFEFLNRFVQNWHYVGGVQDMSALHYVAFASAPFATVLPAVLGTREWLASYPVVDRAFGAWIPLPMRRPRMLAWSVLLVSTVGLAGIGIWPNQLFPLLWISPLLIVWAVQMLQGDAGIFAELAAGDWRRLATAALAALICGFFWELWNMFSDAKWVYQIPYVHTAKIFEMPILGYAGYLPFGLECLVIGDLAVKKSVLTLARGRAITNLVSPHGPPGTPVGGV